MPHTQVNAVTPLQNINPDDYSIRAYRTQDVKDFNYDGPRDFLKLSEVAAALRGPLYSDLSPLQQNISQLQTQNTQMQQMFSSFQASLSPMSDEMAQLKVQIQQAMQLANQAQAQAQARQIIISPTQPTNATAGLIWIEETSAGLPKYNWIRRDNKWFTLEPLYSSFASGSINALLSQQLPLNLPCGCGSIYFDGFQATVHIVSKLLTGVGYVITPQYFDWQGNTLNFPNNPNVNTQPYPANSTQVLNPLNLATTMTLAQVSSLNVHIGPVGIPGAIRINCSFRYYGIRS